MGVFNEYRQTTTTSMSALPIEETKGLLPESGST